ncbi:MAG: helix-turn-helix transcriptional regulator, partial [Candidatus Dadabacteria bacterium]|nr:helix-turn-helix transcriptional regulator [Candidatus Dadabacteria bacterium]
MLGDFIREQRKKCLITQEHLASKLGLSRATYVKIELGKRELKVSEAIKLAEFFDMPIEDFLNEREQTSPMIEIEKPKKKKPAEKSNIRISIPQEKMEKFKQVLLYILAKIGARPNMGQ